MSRFQALLVVLLTGTSLELGLIAIKLPTPAAHAAPIQAPGTALEDPHDVLKRQLAEVQRQIADVQRELAGDRQRLAAIERQTAKISESVVKVSQNVDKVAQAREDVATKYKEALSRDDSKRLLMTCYMVAKHFRPATTTFTEALKQRFTDEVDQDSMDLCTSKGWKAASFGDFNIPFTR